jgi:hypothetical protein
VAAGARRRAAAFACGSPRARRGQRVRADATYLAKRLISQLR